VRRTSAARQDPVTSRKDLSRSGWCGWVGGAVVGSRSLLRCRGCEAGWSPRGPRPKWWGLGAAGSAGRGSAIRLLLRCRECESGRSPKGPRPERGVPSRLGLRGAAGPSPGAASLWLHVGAVSERASTGAGVSGRLGLRGAATILHLRVIHARFVPRVDRPTQGKNPRPPGARVAPGGRKILPSRAETRTMLRSRRNPVANAASFGPSRTNAEPCVTPSHAPRARPTPDPSAGRGPFGEQVHSHPQQRSRSRDPPRATQPQVETHPEQRSRRSKPTPTDAAAGRRPPRPTQPQENARPRRSGRVQPPRQRSLIAPTVRYVRSW
jgi:hypothetical protein